MRAALAAAEARAEVETLRAATAEAELAQARALASATEAVIKSLRLEIAKLRREQYGKSSERRARLIDQLELQLEELAAAATEDAIRAEKAARTTRVRAFDRRKPVRKPFPEHLPRERGVVEAPATCSCCGSSRIMKMGEDGEPLCAIGSRTMASETLEIVPRRWKVFQTVREKFACRDCERISQPPFAIVLEPMAHDGSSFHPTPRGWAGPNLLATILFESEPLWRHWFKPNGERPASAAQPAGGALRSRGRRSQPLDPGRPGRRLQHRAGADPRPDPGARPGRRTAARRR